MEGELGFGRFRASSGEAAGDEGADGGVGAGDGKDGDAGGDGGCGDLAAGVGDAGRAGVETTAMRAPALSAAASSMARPASLCLW